MNDVYDDYCVEEIVVVVVVVVVNVKPHMSFYEQHDTNIIPVHHLL